MARDERIIPVDEVAAMFRVDPKTVVRWDGKHGFPLPIRTPGGHRRYLRAEVEEYMRRTIAGRGAR